MSSTKRPSHWPMAPFGLADSPEFTQLSSVAVEFGAAEKVKLKVNKDRSPMLHLEISSKQHQVSRLARWLRNGIITYAKFALRIPPGWPMWTKQIGNFDFETVSEQCVWPEDVHQNDGARSRAPFVWYSIRGMTSKSLTRKFMAKTEEQKLAKTNNKHYRQTIERQGLLLRYRREHQDERLWRLVDSSWSWRPFSWHFCFTHHLAPFFPTHFDLMYLYSREGRQGKQQGPD